MKCHECGKETRRLVETIKETGLMEGGSYREEEMLCLKCFNNNENWE